MPPFSILFPAAGRSTRFGGPVSKIFAPLAGQTVLAHSLACFTSREDVAQIIIAAGDQAAVEKIVSDFPKSHREKIQLCPGGISRAHSVKNALDCCDPKIAWLAVHDAARPLTSPELIDRVFTSARTAGCAVAAMPVALTIKQARGPLPALVEKTIPRDQLWAMQTPQAMRRDDLLRAYETCPIPLEQVTDDVQLIELACRRVTLVQGENENIKITTPMDLDLAELILARRNRGA